MQNLRHPNFILSIISAIILLIGIGMRVNGYAGGDYVIAFAILQGVACPVLGGMLFYALHQEREKIVTQTQIIL